MRFKKILCPTDFSDDAREALRVALDFARESKGEVAILHVHQVPGVGFSEGVVAPDFVAAASEQAEEQLQAWRKEAEGTGSARVTAEKVMGAPWEEIVRVAREGNYGLIVVATHGRTGIKRALLGSVAEKVVRHAPCPVLIVRKYDE